MNRFIKLSIFSFLLFVLLILGNYGNAQPFPVLQWQKFMDFGGNEVASKIVKSADGMLWIGGNSRAKDEDNSMCANVWLSKIDTAGNIVAEKVIELKGCESLKDIMATPDGGVLWVGSAVGQLENVQKNATAVQTDWVVGKLNAKAEVEWTRFFGGSFSDIARAVTEGPYGAYWIAGSTHSYNGDVSTSYGLNDIWILQLNERGEIQRNIVMGGEKHEWPTAMYRCANGDILITGYTNSSDWVTSSNSIYGGGFLLRINSYGQLLWNRGFECPRGGYFTGISENESGQIWLTGTINQKDQAGQFWYMQLDPSGEKQREYVLKQPYNEILNAISHTGDGGYIFAGSADMGYQKPAPDDKVNKGRMDFWLMRTDRRGVVQWRKTYGGSDSESCHDVVNYGEGTYFAVGSKQNYFTGNGKGTEDAWILKIKELSCEVLETEIFVRAEKFHADFHKPIRFRARHNYGDRFLWDFGDGTTSDEVEPLKKYRYPGSYPITLTVYANENCRRQVRLKKKLEVW